MKKLHRYILGEMLVYFLLCLFLLTFLLLLNRMFQLTELVVAKGVPLAIVGQLLLAVLPVFLLATLPMSALIASILVFSRLSNDSEFIAMTASGMSLYSQLVPVGAMGLLAAVLSAVLTLYGLPWSHEATQALTKDLVKSRAAAFEIREQVFNDAFDGIVIYVRKIDKKSRVMRGVLISDSRDPDKSQVIFADRGILVNDPEKNRLVLRLVSGTMHTSGGGMPGGSPSRPQGGKSERRAPSNYQVVRFGSYDLNMDLTKSIGQAKALRVSLRALPMGDLRRALAAEKPGTNRYNSMIIEMHQRFVTPLAGLILAFLGAPLGVQNRRSGRHGGFALSLGVLLAYYILSTFTESLGESGAIPPALAAWGPNVLLSIAAVWAVRKVVHRGAVDFLGTLADAAARLPLPRRFFAKPA